MRIISGKYRGKKLKEFKNIDSNDRIKIFQSAKPIQYYLQKKEN